MIAIFRFRIKSFAQHVISTLCHSPPTTITLRFTSSLGASSSPTPPLRRCALAQRARGFFLAAVLLLYIARISHIDFQVQRNVYGMDLLDGVAPAASDSKAEEGSSGARLSKHPKHSNKDECTKGELMKIMGKMLLAHALQIRVMRSIIIDCAKVATECEWIKVHKAATEEFNKRAEKMREGGTSSEDVTDQIGVPSVHGFNSWVKLYIQKKLPAHTQMVEAVALWRTQEGWRTIHHHIKHCKVTRMFRSEWKRLEVSAPLDQTTSIADDSMADVQSFTPTWAWQRIRAAMQADKEAKYRQMEGVAPKGDMEKKIQEFLDSVKD